jgi:hypothetical protein
MDQTFKILLCMLASIVYAFSDEIKSDVIFESSIDGTVKLLCWNNANVILSKSIIGGVHSKEKRLVYNICKGELILSPHEYTWNTYYIPRDKIVDNITHMYYFPKYKVLIGMGRNASLAFDNEENEKRLPFMFNFKTSNAKFFETLAELKLFLKTNYDIKDIDFQFKTSENEFEEITKIAIPFESTSYYRTTEGK